MCNYKNWKTSQVFYDSNGEIASFTGPNDVLYLIYQESDLYQDKGDTSELDWYDQILLETSWYVVPTKYDLIDIALDQSLFADLWYFTKFESAG
jgi:hypothetical protein